MTGLQKLRSVCPVKVRRHLRVTATCLHCTYWGSMLFSDPGYLTPVYGGLLILTFLSHYLLPDVA